MLFVSYIYIHCSNTKSCFIFSQKYRKMSQGINPLLQAAEYIDQWGHLLSLCDVVLHDFAQTSCVCCSSLSCEQDKPSKIFGINKAGVLKTVVCDNCGSMQLWTHCVDMKQSILKNTSKHPKTKMFGWNKCLPLKQSHWTLHGWVFASSVPLNVQSQTMRPQPYGFPNRCYKFVTHISFCLSMTIRHYANPTKTKKMHFTNKWAVKSN